MSTVHDTLAWIAGDDWQINATLIDETGAPYDLAGATVTWALMNGAARALDQDDVVISTVDAAAGRCQINVPAVKTKTLPEGAYTDFIRIEVGGITSTLSVGTIRVRADPWSATEGSTFQLRVVA